MLRVAATSPDLESPARKLRNLERVKDHQNQKYDSPLLKKTCIRQVVLDKWTPLMTAALQAQPHGSAAPLVAANALVGLGGSKGRGRTSELHK